MSEYEQVLGAVLRLERKVDAFLERPKQPLTFTRFARLMGVHPNTVTRWVDARKVKTKEGRIPWSEYVRLSTP